MSTSGSHFSNFLSTTGSYFSTLTKNFSSFSTINSATVSSATTSPPSSAISSASDKKFANAPFFSSISSTAVFSSGNSSPSIKLSAISSTSRAPPALVATTGPGNLLLFQQFYHVLPHLLRHRRFLFLQSLASSSTGSSSRAPCHVCHSGTLRTHPSVTRVE